MGKKPKTISKQQMSGQRGVNLVERLALEMGYLWHPSNPSFDAGIDGIIEVRDPTTGEASNNILQVQIKAVSGALNRETESSFSFNCKERDIEYWLKGNTPVVLIVVKLDSNKAYWIDVKQSFSDRMKQKSNSLTFDKTTQAFDASAAPSLMKLAVPRTVGAYFPAAMRGERLHSNLLLVKKFPPSMHVASTAYRHRQDIFDWARERKVVVPSGWMLANGTIRGIHDLREEPWRELCDFGTAEQFDLSEWSDSDDSDRRREFVRVMNDALKNDMRMRGLWWSKEERCYFFPYKKPEKRRMHSYKSLQKNTSREVVKVIKHKTTGEFRCYRHSSVRQSFVRLSGKWYLQLTPHYIYTLDNKQSYSYADEQLSGMKRLEKQNAVMGQVVMWTDILTQRDSLFNERKYEVVFDRLLTVTCERSLDDEAWRIGDSFKDDETSGSDEEGALF